MAKQKICDGLSVDIDDGWRDKDSFEIKVYMEPLTLAYHDTIYSEIRGPQEVFDQWITGWSIGRYYIASYNIEGDVLHMVNMERGTDCLFFRVLVNGYPIKEEEQRAWGFR